MAKELARVLRPGGILIFNCPWRINLRILKLEEVYWADTKAWRNIPVVQIYRKQPTMVDYEGSKLLANGEGFLMVYE
jgi:hypothetical protein